MTPLVSRTKRYIRYLQTLLSPPVRPADFKLKSAAMAPGTVDSRTSPTQTFEEAILPRRAWICYDMHRPIRAKSGSCYQYLSDRSSLSAGSLLPAKSGVARRGPARPVCVCVGRFVFIVATSRLCLSVCRSPLTLSLRLAASACAAPRRLDGCFPRSNQSVPARFQSY